MYKLNEITNAEFLRTDHGYFNRPIDHQSTTNDQLKPVLTTGLVNTHIDRSIANPDLNEFKEEQFLNHPVNSTWISRREDTRLFCSKWSGNIMLTLWFPLQQGGGGGVRSVLYEGTSL